MALAPAVLAAPGVGDRYGEPCPAPGAPAATAPCQASDARGHPFTANRADLDEPGAIPLRQVASPGQHEEKHGGNPDRNVFASPRMDEAEMCDPAAPHLQFNVPGVQQSGMHAPD